MEAVAVTSLACANWVPGVRACPSGGKKACGRCKLVAYCGAACQKVHWSEHKKACKSDLSKDNWRPQWDIDRREPAWANGSAATNWHNTFGNNKYLWGNVPAVDVVRLERNEGVDHGSDLSVLFAASGDLRNVVKTMADLPNLFLGRVKATVNDREFMIVARNAILLLLALYNDTRESLNATERRGLAETLIHLWYSAFIPAKILSDLSTRVKPLIDVVCDRIEHTTPNSWQGKTWTFESGNSLRLVLKKENWFRLKDFLIAPEALTMEEAKKIRTATTLAPEREDYRDRWYFKDESPFMRVAKHRFQEDGLLLPFGHPREGFSIPNPMFFQASKEWPMDDKADPLAGWPIWEVEHTPSPASQDAYGKLFAYLRLVMSNFIGSLGSGLRDFELYHLDVKELPQYLSQADFDRIEMANISDAGYVGTRESLRLLAPLLRTPRENPHATVITLYLNAVMEVVKGGGEQNALPDMQLLTQYMPKFGTSPPRSLNDADMHRFWDARSLFLNVDKFFKIYMQHQEFSRVSKSLGVMMKPNTIIEPWPTQLRLKPGQKGAQEEFDVLLGSNLSGLEHYVEWKRVR